MDIFFLPQFDQEKVEKFKNYVQKCEKKPSVKEICENTGIEPYLCMQMVREVRINQIHAGYRRNHRNLKNFLD